MLRGVVDRVLLSRDQQRVLWEQVISESRDGARLMNIPGAATRAREAWELVHSHQVPFPSPLFDRAPETRAFAGWAFAFDRVCDRNSWIDSARSVDELARSAAALRDVVPSLVTYGFDEVTPQQRAFLDALRAGGIHVEELGFIEQLRLDGSRGDEHVRQFAANDLEDELRRAGLWARDRLEAKLTAQIGIIVPRLSELRGMVERILTEVLQPEILFVGHEAAQPAFELSLGGALAECGLVDTALRALRLAAGSLPLEEAGRLVRSPYISGAEEERSTRAAFELALRRCKTPEITPEQLLTEARSAECTVLTRQLAAFQSKCAPFAEHHAPSKWAQHISVVLTALGWPGTLESTEYQAHEAFLEQLRRFSAIEVVRPAKMAAAQAVQELSRMTREQAFRPRNNNSPIQVLGLLEAAGSAFDALWVCGMNDEAWPPRGSANPFIPAALQIKHALPHSSPERDNEYAARILSRVYASAGDVVVSWPKRDKDRELRPAPQIAHLAVAAEIKKEPALACYFQVADCDTFADEQAPPASPGMQLGGIKIFEFQSTCPFRAFAQTRLFARSLDEAYAGPNPIERGQLVEDVLQRVWTELGDWQGLNAVFETPELQEIIARAVDGTLRQLLPQPGRWYDNYRAVERGRLAQLTTKWLELERRRTPFQGVVHQREIEVAVGEIAIKARVDRIDQLADGSTVIIDYKTGEASWKTWLAPRMEKPQLPLYAIAQAPGSVSGVAFGVARTEKCDLSGYARAGDVLGKNNDNCQRDMGREIAGWREELEGVAVAYLEGDAAVDPKSARKTCKWCHLGPLCRVHELAAAEVSDDV
jgi:probable DNA repair protein